MGHAHQSGSGAITNISPLRHRLQALQGDSPDQIPLSRQQDLRTMLQRGRQGVLVPRGGLPDDPQAAARSFVFAAIDVAAEEGGVLPLPLLHLISPYR